MYIINIHIRNIDYSMNIKKINCLLYKRTKKNEDNNILKIWFETWIFIRSDLNFANPNKYIPTPI